MSYAVIDIVFALLLLFCIIRVTVKGFISEFFSKAAVILGVLGAVLFFKKLAPYAAKLLGENVFSEIVAFLLIFIGIYIIIKITQTCVGSLFKGESLSALDRALGFFLGLLEGLLVIAVCLIVIRLQPFFDPESLTHSSFFSRLFSPFLSAPEVTLREFITG
ncbi:MAG: CvpA family protein [Spirochaetaceae bacterium]|jgi:membrane protein required for colicin V production|nr:CvpA family protein [Spirochaetaceae bacterium]